MGQDRRKHTKGTKQCEKLRREDLDVCRNDKTSGSRERQKGLGLRNEPNSQRINHRQMTCQSEEGVVSQHGLRTTANSHGTELRSPEQRYSDPYV